MCSQKKYAYSANKAAAQSSGCGGAGAQQQRPAPGSSLRCKRTKKWTQTTRLRLTGLIAQALPPLAAHPRTAVRVALAQGAPSCILSTHRLLTLPATACISATVIPSCKLKITLSRRCTQASECLSSRRLQRHRSCPLAAGRRNGASVPSKSGLWQIQACCPILYHCRAANPSCTLYR